MRMRKKSKSGMRNYIGDSVIKGYSLNQIKKTLIANDYSKRRAEAIINDYNDHLQRRGRFISNNILALIVLCFMFVSLVSNYYIITYYPSAPKFTGMSSAIGIARLCVNTRPTLDISDCANSVNVSDEYYCVVTAGDSDGNTVFTFYDNVTFLNISLLSGIINFTPATADLGSYHINITVQDGSGCDNGWEMDILNLSILTICSMKNPPVFNNLSTNYTILRDRDWSLRINATDDDGDTITYSVTEVNNTAYSSFGAVMELDSSIGLLNITPTIAHVRNHILNISARDNSNCPNDTAWQLVEIIVDANNTIPIYIGAAGDLDHTWNEDTTESNLYNLDDYFNDSDGDCLKYEVEYLSPHSFISVSIANNIDPRAGSCPTSHYATLTPASNRFGVETICFRANDTIDVSTQVCVKYHVQNVPEPVIIPSTALSSGGGAGGAGIAKPKRCEERWYCSAWSECIGGFMLRNCSDINKCKTSKYKPDETKACVYIEHCYDGVQNYGEEGIDCGGECSVDCVTCYDGIMNCHTLLNGTLLCEEGVDCGGPCRLCLEGEIIELEDEELPAPRQTYLFRYDLLLWLLLLLLLLLLLFALIKRLVKKKTRDEIKGKFDGSMRKARKLWYMLLFLVKGKKDSKLKEKMKGHAESGDILSRVRSLGMKLGKISNHEIIKELSKIMRIWLKQRFNFEYEATVEDLLLQIKDKKGLDMIKRIKPFFDKLTHIAYSGEEVNNEEAAALISKAVKIIESNKPMIRNKTATKKDVSKKKGNKKISLVILLIIAILGSMLFMFRTEITGMVIGDQSMQATIDINEEFAVNSVYPLNIGDADPESVKLSGRVSKDSDIMIYAGSLDDNYIVFDSKLLQKKATLSKRIKTDQIKEFTGGKEIDLKIDYNKDTPWDSDNDGISGIDEAVDVTIKDSLFSWDADESKLCTLWKVSNDAGNEYACYGGYDCCSLLELVPERDRWDDTLYLTYGKYDSVEENIVSAKLIYADYSLDAANAYSEIIESETEEISVSFEDEMIEFNDICMESCLLAGLLDDKLIIVINEGRIYLEKATYSTEGIILNNVPEFKTIPNIIIDKDKEYSFDINDYVTDPDGDELVIDFYELDKLDIGISDGIVTIVPGEGFMGKVYTFFIANDSRQIGISNMVEISVGDITEQTIQGRAVVGKPVKWVKRVKAGDNLTSVIGLDYKPINVSVKKIEEGEETKVDNSRVRLNIGGELVDIGDYSFEKKPAKDLEVKGITGAQSFTLSEEGESQEENIEVIVEEQADEIEVEYYTGGPEAIEEVITGYKRRIIISSDIHYTDITAFTGIDEMPLASIKLYHISDGSRDEVDFEGFDRNNNGLIDYIEWIVPHLSEETYEVEITVLNVQSYPTVGGGWEVRFTTLGKANLTISAINLTIYGSEVPSDLTPKELRCGDDVLAYGWDGGDDAIYYDYECNETGYWIVTVLTAGVHNQRFRFGEAEAYANNYASVKSGQTNLTVWDSTDSGNWYAASNITFYANYTNGTNIANGTCTIKFNYTGVGGWQDEDNMTYNGVNLPWNYSRMIPYKGTSYFNVRCENESMAALNVTDAINIKNSAPVMNLTSEKLPSLTCTEDIACAYNLSKQVTEYDLNDLLSYDYTAGSISNMTSHADCGNCWSFDFTNGNLTVYITTSRHANEGSWSPLLTAEDSDSGSVSGTLDITVNAVNDPPTIDTPSGNYLSDATTETEYNYQMAASDEEDSTISIFNFTIFWCNRSFVDNCDGVSIWMNTSTGFFNYTPVNNDAGNYSLNISATDNDGATTSRLVNFTIFDINNAPSFSYVCDDSRSAIEDAHFSCIINASDAESDSLTFTSSLSWFTLDWAADNEVLANFTPLNQHVGNHTIQINVTDGFYTNTVLINFSVNNTNDMPMLFNISNQLAIVGKEYSYYAGAHDDDFWQPDNTFNTNNENLSFDINLSWFDISKFNATAAYINFTPSESNKGNYTVLINVTDISNSIYNMTFNLTIRNNTAPQFDWICNNSRIIQEEALHSCIVNATDLEGDNFTFSTNTSWFIINITTGNVSFVVNDSEVGNHTILFKVNDTWGTTSYASASFTVNNTQEKPVLNISNVSVQEGQLLDYNAANDVYDEDMNTPESDTINYSINSTYLITFPSGYNLTINKSTGIMNFTPQPTDVGIYHINVSVVDKYGLSDSKVINFTVTDINNPPALDYVCDNERNATQDALFNCTINATDADNDILSFWANATWFNITSISNLAALASFTPSNSEVGKYMINITVGDGQYNYSELISFNVSNKNDAPNLTSIGNLNATEDFSFNYTLAATDIDTDTPDNDTFTFGSNSSFFTVNPGTGYFNFTPNSSQVGNYTINFTVTDTAGALDFEIVNFVIFEYNDPPVLDFILNILVQENESYYYDVNATDEEDGNDTSGLLRFSWNHTQGWFVLNAISGEISFIANSTMIGNQTINLTVNDTGGKIDWQVFNATILQFNSMPNIIQIMPYGTPVSNSTVEAFADIGLFPNNITSITLVENSTILFNHTSIDADGDTLNSTWSKDNSVVYSTLDNSYIYTPDFDEAGQHNIIVLVSDGRGLNDSFSWNVTVNNTNREPIFGMREHDSYSDFNSGTDNINDTNITQGGIILAANGSSGYNMSGEFIANLNIPITTSTSNYNPIEFTNISWSAQIPDGTNVTVQTRTKASLSSSWGNWSIMVINRSYTNFSGEQIVSENASYLQYKLILQTNDSSITPNVTNVKIQYILPDFTITEGSTFYNMIDLDDHFYDLDIDNSLVFNASETSCIQLTVDDSNIVDIEVPYGCSGTQLLYFTANDSYATISSNNITITIEPADVMSDITYVYLTSTRTVVKTRTRTVTEPRYLELLAPEHITAFSDDTVMAPIVLNNNGESILNDIEMVAGVNSDLVDIWFSDDNVGSLSPGQTAKTNLYIKWMGSVSEFDVIVNATSTDPSYTDSVIISVTGVARVEDDRSIQEQHVEFVRDLLNNNPECLELTELLIEAERLFDAGNYKETRNKLNFVIDGCRYLTTTQKDIEQPTPIRQREGDLFKLISGILLLLLLITVIIIIALANKERRLS